MRSLKSFRLNAVSRAIVPIIYCFLVLSFSLVAKAQPAPVVINFEGLPAAPVLNQYAGQGVTFNGPIATDFATWPGFAHSGTHGAQHCFAQEFCSAPLVVNFTTGQTRAKLWVGYIAQLSVARSILLQARDANGALLSEVRALIGPSAVPIPITTPLEVNSPVANIRQLSLRFDEGPGVTTFNTGLLIDDLEFTSAGPAPACATSERPWVELTQPASSFLGGSTTVQINEFMLQGRIQTAVPLDSATLTITRPDGSTKPMDLLGPGIVSGSGGNFGATRINSGLLPGTNNVAIRVRNCAGEYADDGNVIFTPIPAGVGFKILRIEATQVTQDLLNSVPLVADKPTYVRVYLQVTGPANSVSGISGALTATRPNGSTEAPLLTSTNAITVNDSPDLGSKRVILNGSLNFALPPSWIREGMIHLQLSKIYLNGHETLMACDGCANLDGNFPRYTRFFATKNLNLVIAPYHYQASNLSPDFLYTGTRALGWLNNVFPLRGGFPSSSTGINVLKILLQDSTNNDLHSTIPGPDSGNFLDELQCLRNHLLANNSGWPSDMRLLAVVPFGRGGAATGKVAYVDSWAYENGPIPQESFAGYGRTWAHETAHTFGRLHASSVHGEDDVDPQFPYPHGGIGHPGLAITTLWWNSNPFLIPPGESAEGQPHAHDMMSYGFSGTGWISPYSYKALFKAFEVSTQANIAAPRREEKLVLVGRLDSNGMVNLRPLLRVTTEYVSSAGTAGEYSIDLVGANGKTLQNHRFDPDRESDGKGRLSFSEFVPWKDGTRTILIKRRGTIIAKKSVSSNSPWVRIMSPAKGGDVGKKATFSWTGGDNDRDPITYTVLYNSGVDSTWTPIAHCLTATSITIDTTRLPGSTRARIRVLATDGVNTTQADSELFTVAGKQPEVAILRPTQNEVIAPDTVPQLIGVAYDPEDGMLPATNLTWTSDRDGILGHGDCQTLKALSRGRHVITLTATDTGGNSVSSRVHVLVGLDQFTVR